ncbi:nucleotidyl transferase AbiEii/AbiGii toxin family protein [Sphingobacterium prati]|jgi:predicted nucleotidyltransferase component of viral defense system|uniref:nucleotidyl transferase AbiEii/AbiGii toxin family protein n=1 Tax=Sphingobacterium prati TaxID=2737006 RepID=UPI0015574504|nr:nucleotidyl transferase AbiEii/AbiGii toxin family protein [Sphingobacterium prati]NPE44882.1 nucleotidyl transferase AbiEii/AbiGii toxin family protein [Sphingobacterium prati]
MYLHQHKSFKDLLLAESEERAIDPILIEKDYWIMHCLYGLQKLGFRFELKGGTSLSKAYKIIDRFSEDIDIHIHPGATLGINENPKNTNANNVAKRLAFYDMLADEIKIEGIEVVERDTFFDDTDYYRSGGIRLIYNSFFNALPGLKEGILLEVGFDNVTPNNPMDISSWAFDKALQASTSLTDNRALQIPCYDMRYTFVEKLQTIATKFRNMQSSGNSQANFMRQYYDIYQLLNQQEVKEFIGTPEYLNHKERRFPNADFEIPISQNQAFLLEDDKLKQQLNQSYIKSKALYYNGQIDLQSILDLLKIHLKNL